MLHTKTAVQTYKVSEPYVTQVQRPGTLVMWAIDYGYGYVQVGFEDGWQGVCAHGAVVDTEEEQEAA